MKTLSLHLSNQIEGCFEASIQNSLLYLNKSFIIDQILIDNSQKTHEIIRDVKWQVIKLPSGAKTIKIKYHGFLDGKSGLYPYVKENSKDEFYLLRHETIYYPSFYEIDSEEFLEHYLYPKAFDEFIVNVEIGDSRLVVSNLKQIESNVYKGYNPVFVIGNYLLKNDYFGKLYYLTDNKEIDSKSLFIKRVNDVLLKYKEVYLNNLKIVIIPAGYGSFVMPDNRTMFITEDSFADPQYIIHELIHLHWNPKIKASVQKSRFFDEAITQYLTLRVLDDLKIKCSKETERLFIDDFKKSVNSYNIELQPLCKFAEENYGFLSYSYGALAILQIENKIGKEAIDRIFRRMINDDRFYDFKEFKNMFEDIEDVWNDCFVTSNYQSYLMKRA